MKQYIYTFLVLIFSTSTFAQSDSLRIEKLKVDILSMIQKQSNNVEKSFAEITDLINDKDKKIETQLTLLDQNLSKSKLLVDSLSQKLKSSEISIGKLELKVSELENQLRNKIEGINDKTSQLDEVTNNLSEGLTNTKNNVDQIEVLSTKNASSIETVNLALSKKQQYGILFLGVFLILVLATYVLLTKRQNSNTKLLAAKQQEIFEKQIEDSQQLANWLSEQSSDSLGKHTEGEVDHSFAMRVADEIVRITTNLSRMDSNIRGYKQLSASVRKLEQSLNAHGYELEALLNKPYDNGMNLQVNFVIDENLKEGESIITRVIKPQINYKGKLIQAAQVEVSQGE